MSRGRTIDSTRASLAGHTFHHAWAARSCLELLPTDTDLERIALEGFAKDDTGVDVSQSADEVADLVRYRGAPNAKAARRIEVVQFKYSIARAEVAVRAADLAKTATKFAQAMRDHRADLGRDQADAVLRFEYLTNRPVDRDLAAALEGLASGAPLAHGAADQAEALRQATGLDGDDLAVFARNLSVVGQGGSGPPAAARSGPPDNRSQRPARWFRRGRGARRRPARPRRSQTRSRDRAGRLGDAPRHAGTIRCPDASGRC